MKPTPLLAAVLLALSASAQLQGEITCTPLQPKTPQAGGQFGCGVLNHDGILAVSSNLDGAGKVSLFHPEDSAPYATLTPQGGKPGDEFGRSMAEDGGWLAVGAPFADGPRTGGSGVVHVFKKQQDESWSEVQTIAASDAARGDQFGLTVALSGSTLLVGAPNDAHAGSLSGAVYVFGLVSGTWVQQQKVTAADAAPFDNFGFSLAFDGNTAVVGAPFHDRGSAKGNAGAAYVFQQTGNAAASLLKMPPTTGGPWVQQAELTAGDGAANDEFGSAVTVSGSDLAVGARRKDVGGLTDAGAVYVFERAGTAWNFRTLLTAGDAGAGDLFGVSAALSGDQLLVGALFHAGKGAAYLFKRNAGAWVPGDSVNGNPAAGDAFGQAVAIDGTTLVVGSYLADFGSLTNAGSATVCSSGSTPTPPRLQVTDTDGRIQVRTGDTLTYTITVANVGDATATGVTVTDVFSPKLQGFSWSDQTISSLAPGGRVVFTATGTVRDGATGTITNHACAQLPGKPPVCMDDPPDEIIPIPPISADLELTMTASPIAKAADRALFTITVTNHGPGKATGVTLTDSPGSGLKLVDMPDHCLLTGGEVTCTLRDLNAPSPSKPNDQTELVLSFEVTDPCASHFTNHAEVKANEDDPNHDNNHSDVPSDLILEAHLAMQKTGPAAVKPGDPVQYTVTVTNQGPDCATEVEIQDAVPQGLISPVIPPGCSQVQGTIHCPLGDLLPAAQKSVALSFTVPQGTPCGGQITNTATASTGSADPQPAPPATSTAVVASTPLTITKTDGLTNAMPGQGLLYTIVVSNPGACQVDGATVSDVCPDGLTKARWCRGAGCTPDHLGNLLDTLSLPAGASATYQFSGIVAESFTGTVTNVASATAPSGTVSATDTTDVGFTGVKAFCDGLQGLPVEGGTMTYTFVLVNHGPAAQADNPGNEFTDLLPAGLTVTSVAATSGIVTLTNPVTWNGAIPVGGSVTITISVKVDPGTLGMTLCNQASISFDSDGDGVNDTIRFSDDPDEPGTADPCCFEVLPVSAIPTLSGASLAALGLLLAGVGLLRLRRRRV
ncbi:MAG TPA: CARDB domain-containing protein [Thermoanaerobaculia bacterium]|nr:CARDB domain-containing protein [Thermoanaerobaculia bacterium]